MSNDKEVDWEKWRRDVKAPVPEKTPPERVLVELERMRSAKRFSRLNYLGAAVTIGLIILECAGLFLRPEVTFYLVITPLLLTQLHYLFIMNALHKIQTGETK